MKGVAFNAPTEQVWLDIIYVYMFFLALRAPPLSHLAKPRSFYFSATLKNLRFAVPKVRRISGKSLSTPSPPRILAESTFGDVGIGIPFYLIRLNII